MRDGFTSKFEPLLSQKQIKPIRSVRDDVSDAVSAACSLCASTPEKAADTSSIPAGLQTERMKNLKNKAAWNYKQAELAKIEQKMITM